MRNALTIDQIVSQVKDHATSLRDAEAEKTAAEDSPETKMVSDIAVSMFKLASDVRDLDPYCVTHEDVHAFAQKLLEQGNGR